MRPPLHRTFLLALPALLASTALLIAEISDSGTPVPELGLTLSREDADVVVAEVDKSGVGFRSGLRLGDRIIEVDGIAVQGDEVESIVARMYGMRRDLLNLRVRRARGGTQNLQLQRPVRREPPARRDPSRPLALAGPQSSGRPDVIQAAGVAIGGEMIDFTLPRNGGGKVTLSDLKGKPIFLDFWATWCAPCRAEAPALRDLHEFYRGKIHMLGISLDDSPRIAMEYAALYGLTYPQLITDGWLDPVVKEYRVHRTGIPFNVLIDSAGTVVALDLHGQPLARAMEAVVSGE